MPLGSPLYFRVIAIGYNELESDATQVKLGIRQTIVSTLKVTAIKNSVVQQGFSFDTKDPSGMAMIHGESLATFTVN
jgi:hypothetical protein